MDEFTKILFSASLAFILGSVLGEWVKQEYRKSQIRRETLLQHYSEFLGMVHEGIDRLAFISANLMMEQSKKDSPNRLNNMFFQELYNTIDLGGFYRKICRIAIRIRIAEDNIEICNKLRSYCEMFSTQSLPLSWEEFDKLPINQRSEIEDKVEMTLGEIMNYVEQKYFKVTFQSRVQRRLDKVKEFIRKI